MPAPVLRVKSGRHGEISDADHEHCRSGLKRPGLAAGISGAIAATSPIRERIKGLAVNILTGPPISYRMRRKNWRRAGSKHPWRSSWKAILLPTPSRGTRLSARRLSLTRKSKFIRWIKTGMGGKILSRHRDSSASFFSAHGRRSPLKAAGASTSAPPWGVAGIWITNTAVAGTTLYIPVHAPRALFEVRRRMPRPRRRRSGHHRA